MIAMQTFPSDAEVPQIATPGALIETDHAFLVIVFGCLACDARFALKVSLYFDMSTIVYDY